VLRWLERALLAVGVVCLGYYWYHVAEARQFQRDQISALERRLGDASARTELPADTATPSALEAPDESDAPSARSARGAPRATGAGSAPGSFALLEIPRLDLLTPILPGDDAATLDRAVGHLPDTPMPWEPGNSALAAHRDGLFRPLRHIRVGDEVRVRSEHGPLLYTVTETKIVTPDDLSVLASQASDTLTLITCYPFNYIGHAPKRFIVHATRAQ
jgi:sortase A